MREYHSRGTTAARTAHTIPLLAGHSSHADITRGKVGETGTGRAGCRLAPPAVAPEGFSDFHGDHPFIELRDPADITRPWRPGSGITDRQAATIAWLQADLRSRASSAQ